MGGDNMKPDKEVTAELVRAALKYSKLTGVFTWSTSSPRGKCGERAGYVHANGYVRIGLFGRKYPAHRLAWLHATGGWPEGQIDHINGIRSDNRLSNLRVVSCQENCKNLKIKATNLSGVLGVSWCRGNELWRARIKVDGRDRHLGYFQELEAARSARRLAEEQFGYHKNHGGRH